MVIKSFSAPRVLVLNWRDPANPLAGGGETHVWRVFQAALRKGWAVEAICSQFPGALVHEVVDGIPVHRCGTELTYAAAVPFTYRRVRTAFKPGLVFEVMDKLPLMTPLYVREPAVCFLHHFFGSAASMEVSWPIARTVQAAEQLVPLVYAHTPFLTGSPSATGELVTMGVHPENVETLRYGVDPFSVGPVAKTRHPSIVYVGRLRRYKHVDHLIRAVARLKLELPSLRLEIVGRGDAEPELRRLTASLDLDSSVGFHGFIPDTEKRRLMGSAWVGCLPSHKEGFGLSIPEAALCGTPSVGYDVPGVCDAIEHGVTGLLAPYPDESALTAELKRVLTGDRYRAALADRAAARYRDFSWDNAAALTIAAMEQRLAAHVVTNKATEAEIDEILTDGARAGTV